MRRAIYSNRLNAWRRICEQPGLVIAPRRYVKLLADDTGCPVVATEDICKTTTWLWLNETVCRDLPLVYWMVSSYKFDSDKARRLDRLATISRNVFLVDVTPFCGTINTLYGTWRYVDRRILGYQHYYAFSGGHAEIHRGNVVPSLNPELNAWKIAPHCYIDRSPVRDQRITIRCSYTSEEHAQYNARREELFASKRSPQPILTNLSDLVHGFETRRDCVIEHANGQSIIVANLDSYARWYRNRGYQSCTYARPSDVSTCDRIVFAEPPIVYPYRRIHIEAQAREDCETVDVLGDAKVDGFLGSRTATEVAVIGQFCELLREEHARLSN